MSYKNFKSSQLPTFYPKQAFYFKRSITNTYYSSIALQKCITHFYPLVCIRDERVINDIQISSMVLNTQIIQRKLPITTKLLNILGFQTWKIFQYLNNTVFPTCPTVKQCLHKKLIFQNYLFHRINNNILLPDILRGVQLKMSIQKFLQTQYLTFDTPIQTRRFQMIHYLENVASI